MTGFDPVWLALREPADHAARAPALLDAAARAAGSAGRGPLVVDLGCGTGSNMRALAPRLAGAARWRLVDNDPILLAEAARRGAAGADTVSADLNDVASLPLDGATLVTAAALFDLVSETWLRRLVGRVAAARLPLYAALTYDGQTDWTPPHPSDRAMHAALDAHQRTDKGFGPALGPAAASCLGALLRDHGYSVRTAESPWRLGPADAALIVATTAGYTAAALDLGLADPASAARWQAFRIETAPAGTMLVGHTDLLATPG